MGGLVPWGCGVESVGGGDTWTLLFCTMRWVLKLQVVGILGNYFLHHGVGVETAGGEDT